jgi:hypothetical protein
VTAVAGEGDGDRVGGQAGRVVLLGLHDKREGVRYGLAVYGGLLSRDRPGFQAAFSSSLTMPCDCMSAPATSHRSVRQ